MNMTRRILNHGVNLIVASAVLLAAVASTAAEFYVAPGGNDVDPGTKEKPFATPARAMEAVRALVAGGLKGDIRVVLRARWPHADGLLHVATVSNEVKLFTFDRSLPKDNLGGHGAELVIYENWSVSRALVTSTDERQLATATAVGWIGHGDMTTASPGKPAFIDHTRAGLDQPGAWYLDRPTGTLTYVAAAGEEPSTTVAVAPVLTQLLKIAGTKDKPVRNVRFEGLRFEHTDFVLPSIGYSEIQAAHFGPSMKEPTPVQPVAIECAYAEGIRFERCRLAHLNNSGIGFGPGCRQNAVIGCAIEDIGGCGVMVGWRGVGRLTPGASWNTITSTT
jgi:hypothetical protein